jgi:hypothetical protein
MTAIPGLLEAINHPKLFRPWFKGPSWDGWRAVRKATTAAPIGPPPWTPEIGADLGALGYRSRAPAYPMLTHGGWD